MPSDPIAHFSGSPKTLIVDGSDAWECIDPLLNNFLGYGIETNVLSARIRRGPMGIDGLCQWLDICVKELGISEALLEGKVERLIKAVEAWYVCTHCLRSLTDPVTIALRRKAPLHRALPHLHRAQTLCPLRIKTLLLPPRPSPLSPHPSWMLPAPDTI